MATRSTPQEEGVSARVAEHDELPNPAARVTEDGELLAPRRTSEHVIFEEPPLG